MIYKTIKSFILPQIIYLQWVNMPRVSDSPFSLYFTSKGWFGSSACFWLKKKTTHKKQQQKTVCISNKIYPSNPYLYLLAYLLCVSSIRSWALREHFVHKFIVWCLMSSIFSNKFYWMKVESWPRDAPTQVTPVCSWDWKFKRDNACTHACTQNCYEHIIHYYSIYKHH